MLSLSLTGPQPPPPPGHSTLLDGSMVSDDKVALSTLDDIVSLLKGWKRAAEEGPLTPRRAPQKAARPSSARPSSARRSRFGALQEEARPALTPATSYNYVLGLQDRETPRVQDYRARLRTSASTLTDSVGLLRAMERTKRYSRDATSTSADPRRHSPCRQEQQDFDFVTFADPPPPPKQRGVINVSVRPLSAREPREAATLRLQRPASARMASSQDEEYSPVGFATISQGAHRQASRQQSVKSCSARTSLAQPGSLSVRKWDGGDSVFAPIRIQAPAGMIHDSSGDGHLRWLNVATCAELVDAICRRPHAELVQHARRLQDHLQMLSVVSHTHTSRTMLESQQETIQSLYEGLHEAKKEADNLREALARRQQNSRSHSPQSGKASRPVSAGTGAASEEDDYIIDVDAEEEDTSIELFESTKIGRSNESTSSERQGSSGSTRRSSSEEMIAASTSMPHSRTPSFFKRTKQEQENNEAIVRVANEEYAQHEGVRVGAYLQDIEFYQGLDSYNGMPVAAGELELFKMMEGEFCGGDDADTLFTTWNYGGLQTTLRLEWLYVVDPERGQQELSRMGLKEYAGFSPKQDQDGKPYPQRDGGSQRPLGSFVTHDMARKAKLRKAEVVGLRLHTGPAYMKINGRLRQGRMDRAGGKGAFVVTISMVNSAIRKLVRVTPVKSDKLFRGVSNMTMPDQIFVRDKKNCRGFVEPGFSSATTDRQVALRYAGTVCPSIFEISTGQVDHGADLTWISQFPAEKEMIILPLSNFEVVSMRREDNVNVFECSLNLNMGSKTLEDLLEQRKISVVDFGKCLWNEAQLVVNTPPIEPGILSDETFCQQYLLGDICDQEPQWFDDLNNYYECLHGLFMKWSWSMHEAAKALKNKAEELLRKNAADLLQEGYDGGVQANAKLEEEDEARAGLQAEDGGSRLKICVESEMHDLKHAKILLHRAVKILERTNFLNKGINVRESASMAMLVDIQTDLLPSVIQLQSPGTNTAELATALMKKTNILMQVAAPDDMDQIISSFVAAINARCDAFSMRASDKLNAKQAEKLLKRIREARKASRGSESSENFPNLDLWSWVYSNDAFFTARTEREKKIEAREVCQMLHGFEKFGLLSLEDAVAYLKKEDLLAMDLDSKRQEVLVAQLESVRENVKRQTNELQSTDGKGDKKLTVDEWLRRKDAEERRKRKEKQDLKKAASRKEPAVRLDEDLAKFRTSDSYSTWRKERELENAGGSQ